jgi:hypothetical protein
MPINQRFSSTKSHPFNAKIATAILEAMEKNPTLKSRVINALKVGGTEAIKELLDHPAVNFLRTCLRSLRRGGKPFQYEPKSPSQNNPYNLGEIDLS